MGRGVSKLLELFEQRLGEETDRQTDRLLRVEGTEASLKAAGAFKTDVVWFSASRKDSVEGTGTCHSLVIEGPCVGTGCDLLWASFSSDLGKSAGRNLIHRIEKTWVGKEEAQERGCVNSVIAEMAQNPSCGC